MPETPNRSMSNPLADKAMLLVILAIMIIVGFVDRIFRKRRDGDNSARRERAWYPEF
jgi:type II secretory pathway component PulK